LDDAELVESKREGKVHGIIGTIEEKQTEYGKHALSDEPKACFCIVHSVNIFLPNAIAYDIMYRGYLYNNEVMLNGVKRNN